MITAGLIVTALAVVLATIIAKGKHPAGNDPDERTQWPEYHND